MDFIRKLLLFSKFDTILVIVDQLAKQVIFIFTHNTIISTDLAYLFVLYMFSKHSISFYVTSNRDLEFVSKFFYSLSTTLDVQFHFTLGYHSEGNRQIEHIKQTLQQYLHVYCNYQQNNQFKLLLLVELSYNNTSSTMT